MTSTTVQVSYSAARANPIRAAWLSVLTAVCLILAGAMVADTIATILRLHSALPYFDEWDDLDLFRSTLRSATPLADLFSQHNEHRIFFPRLILYSDLLFFGGRGLLDRIAIFAIQIGHVVLLLALLRGACAARAGRLALAAVVVALFFSLRQEENFSWSFQVQFVGIFALASVACVLFATALDRIRIGRPAIAWLAGAYLFAAMATFTMANGLLCALVLIGLAVAVRAPARVILASVAVAILLAAAYLHGYEPQPAHTPLSFALRHPARVVSYTAVYLGNFLDPDLPAARALGLWGFAAVAFAAVRILWMRDRLPSRVALFGIMLFTLGTALITALGRVGFGLDQALSSRYSTGSAAFWAAALIYAWSVAAERHRPSVLRVGVALTALVLVTGAIRAQGIMKSGMEDRAYGQAQSTDALLLGLHDTIAFGMIDDDDRLVLDLSTFLKSRGLSIFRDRDAALVGHPLSEAGSLVAASACRGSVDAVLPAPDLGAGGIRLSGHAWGLGHNRLTGRVYIVDHTDKIVGLASHEPSGQDPSVWNGVAVGAPDEPLRSFELMSRGRLCPTGESAPAAAAASNP